jgi:protein YibB
MSELTLVTDFFDIGRGTDKNAELRRTASKYMEEFKRWARIKNPLVVYTDPVSAKEIRTIRREFGLEDQTTIIEIEDLFGLEPDLYAGMVKNSKSEPFLKFRYLPEASSNNPKYDYLWMMKYYFMNDAYNRGLLNENVAWVDFGFDHGGVTYCDENDFDFTWEYDFGGKIHIFCLNDPDTVSCITTLQYLPDCVMGCMYGLSREMVPTFWKIVREAMEALLMIECVDDDQELVLMAYKKYPQYFTVHVTGWQLALKECGGDHMKVRKAEPTPEENSLRRWIRLTVRKVIPNRKDPARIYAARCMEEAKRIHGR